MSARYEAREMTTSGWGRRFHSDRLSTVREIVVHLGGHWRIRRQWFDGKRWRLDGGQNAERWMRIR